MQVCWSSEGQLFGSGGESKKSMRAMETVHSRLRQGLVKIVVQRYGLPGDHDGGRRSQVVAACCGDVEMCPVTRGSRLKALESSQQLSSVSPSQSLSRPSQTSSTGSIPEHSPQVPLALQVTVPFSHSPSLVEHSAIPPRLQQAATPSSISPSQSLSSVSQVSTPLPSIGSQNPGAPPTQAITSWSHSPSPQEMVPRSSSVLPSQSLSLPSQTSGDPEETHWPS